MEEVRHALRPLTNEPIASQRCRPTFASTRRPSRCLIGTEMLNNDRGTMEDNQVHT
jgi:hypothetical protein